MAAAHRRGRCSTEHQLISPPSQAVDVKYTQVKVKKNPTEVW